MSQRMVMMVVRPSGHADVGLETAKQKTHQANTAETQDMLAEMASRCYQQSETWAGDVLWMQKDALPSLFTSLYSRVGLIGQVHI